MALLEIPNQLLQPWMIDFLVEEDLSACHDDGKRCDEVVDSEAAMLAIIKLLRERIDGLEGRIKELEARPYGYYPITYPAPNTGGHVPYPWTITCRR